MWKWLEKLKNPKPCGCCDESGLPIPRWPAPPMPEVPEPKPEPIIKPVQLFELIVVGGGWEHKYEDLTGYEYSSNKKGELKLDLKYANNKYRQVRYADGYWLIVSSGFQDLKNADAEQVKLAWEDPEQKKLPEFPITLGDPPV
jgi:hypothetical protein